MVNQTTYGQNGTLKSEAAFEEGYMGGITTSYYENGILKKVTKIYVRGMKLQETTKGLPGHGKVQEKTIYGDGKPIGPSKNKE
jgi:antitoxin component YwqK of YwqJK toxin-antitoxin module